MNEYVEIVLWIFALGYILASAYQEVVRGDDEKSMKHEVSAILFLALLIAGNVT